ncbi:hypothetical protein PLIIFM63780_005544 [Purpureocillium lilacinum]|nr:hypothetical protein PLIIFM63780_005544 [Purpureocillium lilacinum]
MQVKSINTSAFTHIHFAFASVSSTFEVNISDVKYDIDGLDFDWEYPGAPDIPDIPPGTHAEAENYLSFLRALRKVLPQRITLSVALPASYWYLAPYPVFRMAAVVDYYVYMTYDLHGQWVEDYYDESSDSNILVYGDDSGSDWVAYMDGDVKSKRIEFIRSINFAGVADWAVDLESFTGDYPEEDSDPDDPEIDVSDLEKLLCPIDMNPGSMRALLEKSDTIPSICRAQFAAKILHQDLDDAVTKYAEAATGFDDLFGYYADWLKDSINSRLEDFMSFEDGKGNKYFKCHWRYGIVDDSGPCTGMPQFWKDLISYTVTYELQDERGFFDALEEELGIEKDWVRFGIQQSPPGCDTTGDDYWLPGAPIRHCRRIYQTRVGFPMRVDKDRINVGNPKALIEAAMPNITMLQISSLAAYGELVMSCYDLTNPENTNTDVVVAMSMPVYQLQEAVDNMKEIKSIGEKARDAKKKDLILMILGIVLLILPFAGELLGPVVGSATQAFW